MVVCQEYWKCVPLKTLQTVHIVLLPSLLDALIQLCRLPIRSVSLVSFARTLSCFSSSHKFHLDPLAPLPLGRSFLLIPPPSLEKAPFLA